MLDTFIKSFKLKNTYKTNTILYSIREIPFLKKIIPYNLYANNGFKSFISVISIIMKIFKTFLGKFAYILILIFTISSLYDLESSVVFLHIFTFLTLAGFINKFIFEPEKYLYYAIFIIKIDAKKYAISNYYYYLLKTFISFIPFTIIFGLISKVPLWLCLLMPIFVIMVKAIIINYDLYSYKKKQINMILKSTICLLVLFVLAYGLPFIGIVININIFLILFILSLILGIISLYKINEFNNYRKMFREIFDSNHHYDKKDNSQLIKENMREKIEYDKKNSSDKIGLAYFHDLFVKRHKKILTQTVKIQTIIISIIFLLLIIIAIYFPELGSLLNNIPLNYLPYFVFIMYILNRGSTLTQAMFMNCDYSMLTYRFYKTPKFILNLFTKRLKTLITLNIYPALAIAISLDILLLVTGGTDNIINYLVLFISIISLSIFFSIHYLVMYYLLQPYNINSELKNGLYKIIQGLTYLICYFMLELELPTISFGLVTIIFSILYSFIALVLAYKLAPKTFKLRN